MHRSVPLIGLVSLVFLAGCGGVFGPDTSATSGTSSGVTPVPVPTDDPLSDPPAGLSEDGINDSFALASAHVDALANASFTVRIDHTLTALNGTRLSDVRTVQRSGANHSRWTTKREFNTTVQYPLYRAMVDNIGIWANGTYGFIRLQGPNGTEYFPRSSEERDDLTRWELLRSYYLEADVTRVSTANGRIQLRASLTPQNTRILTIPTVNVTDRTIVLTLTESGRVERYRVEYTGRLVSEPATVVEGNRVVRFTALDETSLERPGWVPTARNATTPAADMTGYG